MLKVSLKLDKNDIVYLSANKVKYLVTDIYKNYIEFTLDGGFGLIDKKTLIVKLDSIYDLIQEVKLNFKVKLKEESKWGYLDHELNIILPPVYDWIWDYADYLVPRISGKHGLFDLKNKIKLLDNLFVEYKLDDLLKIYHSQMRVEKLRQLEEML
jgi:hypothetical protein